MLVGRRITMKIARVEALHCDGGWRPWTFVRIETDDGLVGWGECSDNRSPHGIAGCVRDLAPLLVGQDPRPVERLYWDMLRATRQNLGGVTHKAMAGIELALWDIKAKALGVPVYELFGGPLRDRMRLYWSHCGTTRARMGSMLGTPPLRTYDDIAALGQGSGRARLHRAQDQHRDPGRSGHRVLPRLRERHQLHRRRAHRGDPGRDRAADRHVPRCGRTEGRAVPRSQLQLPHRGRAAHRQAARAVRHAVDGVRQLGSRRRCCRSSSRPPPAWPPARAW